MGRTHDQSERDDFTDFVKTWERGLRLALVARFGPEVGREAAADALAWAWEHWPQFEDIRNPGGYLFRVAQTKARRYRRREPRFPAPTGQEVPWVEPKLPGALRQLSARQRMVVALVHGLGYTHRETADLLGLSESTVQNHVERAIGKLRRSMGVAGDEG